MLASLAALASAASAVAETKIPSGAKLQKLVEQRRAVLRGALELDDAQQAAFAPLYDEYEKEREVLGRARVGLVDDFTRASLALADADATALLDQLFRLRRQQLELDERFRPRFAAVLPPQKVLLLYQVNLILDSVVNYDLAGMLPLAR